MAPIASRLGIKFSSVEGGRPGWMKSMNRIASLTPLRGLDVFRPLPKRPISLDGYAPGSGPRVDQIESVVRTGIGEQPCALAEDDGIDDQVELVDQVVGEQPSDEDTAAWHQQLAVLLRLQIADGRGDVAGQDTRARPLRIGEAGRCHVLGPAVQCHADWPLGHIDHRSPGAGEDLVRPPAEEERGRTAVDLVDVIPGFGIDKWWSPAAAVEAASAIFVRSTQPLHHAVHRDVGRHRQSHVVVTLPELLVSWWVRWTLSPWSSNNDRSTRRLVVFGPPTPTRRRPASFTPRGPCGPCGPCAPFAASPQDQRPVSPQCPATTDRHRWPIRPRA